MCEMLSQPVPIERSSRKRRSRRRATMAPKSIAANEQLAKKSFRKKYPDAERWAPPTYRKCLSIFISLIFIGHQQQLVECQLRPQFYPMPPTLARQMQAQPNELIQPQPQPPMVVMVPGSGPLLREPSRVDRIIMPNEAVALPISPQNGSVDWAKISYVIDHKRYVEAVTTRCLASTILDDPDSLEPSFIIIRPESEVRLNATSPAELIRKAGFQPQLPTKLFVHGFTQSYPSTDWLRKTRALFELNHQLRDQNLIFMDWGTASHGSYSQVAARSSGMGSFLANFLMKLTDELGAQRMSIHMVCHSLGAHICGFAGKRLQQPSKLGRITALDPAGPCFGKILSNSANDRLSPRDAFEVDVYHYDDDFLGLAGQIGQFDVYVNGGSSQPGAKDNWNTMFQAFVTMVFRRNRVLSESHTRSTEVATSQLAQGGCQSVAYECRDWPAFLSGECGHCDQRNSQCFFMGFPFQYRAQTFGGADAQQLRTSSEGKRLYIATSGKDNFCLQHWQLLVRFEPDPELAQQAKRYRWRLLAELVGESNERINVTLTNQLAPLTFSYLLLGEQQPVRFKSAQLQVRQSDNLVVPLRPPSAGGDRSQQKSRVAVTMMEVNFLSNVNPMVRASFSSRLCPTGYTNNFNSIQDSTDDDDAEDELLAFEDCNRLMGRS